MLAERASRRFVAKAVVASIALASLMAAWIWKGASVKEPLSLLKVHVGIQEAIPDPAKIEVAGDWYFLGHISSGLVGFDHVAGKFKPLLADSWQAFSTGTHTFTLREDARFHDGTPITSDDVIASLKRLIVKRTSTHFPLWEYVEGCEHLKDLAEDCSGLRAINHRTVEIRLKHASESFFLQLASPETGIWSKKDIDPKTLEFKPTKFSGPYSFEGFGDSAAHLRRNEENPISRSFPSSPRRIDLVTAKIDVAQDQFQKGEIDVLFKSHNPYGERDWKALGFDSRASSLSTLIYLHGASLTGSQKVGKDFIEAVWSTNSDREIVKAQKFLPFAGDFGLTPADFLAILPAKTATKIRIAVPWTYLSDGFYGLLVAAGKKVGADIEIIKLPREEWIHSFDDKTAGTRFDFILAPYAASERYPAVQLRYITGSLRNPPIDLKDAESPDLSQEKITILRDYQKWLLSHEHAVPLFFVRDFFLYQHHIDMGDQPPSDAEIELWRITGR
jgi:hypothetical protein